VINKLAGYFSQADLDFKDINSFFKEQIAFILMPDNSKDLFPFLLILENKEKLSEFNQVLDRIELELKHDYNVSFKTYRQSEITILEPLSSSLATNSYVYAQVGNYLIISNSYQSLVLMVDLVINN